MNNFLSARSRTSPHPEQYRLGPTLRILAAVTLCVMVVVLGSCGDFWVDPKLTSVAISPSSSSVEVGKTMQLTAVGGYDDGTSKKLTSDVSWSSSDSTVATVSSSGLLQGINPGTATITASHLDKSGTTTALITLINVESIVVAPSTSSIRSGETQAFTATAILKDGTSVDATEAVTWNSSNQDVAKIASTGVAIGNTVSSVQTTTITATSGSTVSNQVTLTVTP
jgi:uncharacterized protein YjdB